MERAALDGAALDADAAAHALLCVDLRALLEQAAERTELLDLALVGAAAVDVEMRVAVFLPRFVHGEHAALGDDLDLRGIALAHAVLCADHVGRHQRGIEIHQRREHGVQRDRIGRGEDHLHRCRRAGLRAVALHGHHAVHDVQTRAEHPVEVGEHTGKALGVRELHMAGALVQPEDAAEQVLLRAGDALEHVRLHFADVDDGVEGGNLVGEDEFLCRPPVREGDGFAAREVRSADAERRGRFGNAAGCGGRLGRAVAG